MSDTESCIVPSRKKRHYNPCNYYLPQRSCGQGYVFTRVCDSVNRGGRSASVHAEIPPPPPPGSRHPPPEADSVIRSMSNRYASYWNAFFLLCRICQTKMITYAILSTAQHRFKEINQCMSSGGIQYDL